MNRTERWPFFYWQGPLGDPGEPGESGEDGMKVTYFFSVYIYRSVVYASHEIGNDNAYMDLTALFQDLWQMVSKPV